VLLYDEVFESNKSAFKGPLLRSVSAMASTKNRPEHVHDDLVRVLMELSGFIPENGYKLTDHRFTENKLCMIFKGRPSYAILDWAVWMDALYLSRFPQHAIFNRKLLLHAKGTLFSVMISSLIYLEIKLDAQDLNYAQLVGQCLLHAHHNFEKEIFIRNNSVIAYSMALSGWHVRFLTLKCSTEYLGIFLSSFTAI
jgi:hypothetical protein